MEHRVRLTAKETGVPVLVTENGIGTDDDTRRVEFIRRAVAGIERFTPRPASILMTVLVVGVCWAALPHLLPGGLNFTHLLFSKAVFGALLAAAMTPWAITGRLDSSSGFPDSGGQAPASQGSAMFMMKKYIAQGADGPRGPFAMPHGESELAKDKEVSQPLHRERILEAASCVFLASGFEKTSTAEIARLAKVSKRELYSHFSDKRALLAAVVQDLQGHMQERMDDTWGAQARLEEVLLASAKVIQSFILSDRFGKLMRIVAAESYHSPGIAQQFFETGPGQGRKATAQYLKKQMALGKLRKADPMKAADDFLDLVVGAQLMTAVILGQTQTTGSKSARVRHSVEAFLMVYGASTSNGAGSRASLSRK